MPCQTHCTRTPGVFWRNLKSRCPALAVLGWDAYGPAVVALFLKVLVVILVQVRVRIRIGGHRSAGGWRCASPPSRASSGWTEHR
jgi:hypothetical protein